MKIKIFSLSLCLLILLNFTFAFAADSLSDWSYYKDIKAEGSNKYKNIFLDNQVYKYSNTDNNDIRIIDNNNNFVPYYIQNETQYIQSTSVNYGSKKIREIKEKNDSVIDFEVVPKEHNTDILCNQILFNISNAQYLKNIQVLGSYDNQKWEYILDDKIYKVQNAEHNKIQFDDTKKYSFYRIKVIDNIDNVKINGISVINYLSKKQESLYEKTQKLQYQIKQEGKDTIIVINNDNKLKLKQLNIKSDGIFNRRYEIYTKADGRLISTGNEGNIYNFSFSDINISSTLINISNGLNKDYLEVKIVNHDDKPLDIKEIEATYYIDKLVFEANPNNTYRLLFGNLTAQKPSYDIVTYKNHIENEVHDDCTLGSMVNLGGGQQQSTTTDSKFLFNILIIIVAIALISILIVKLRPKN